MLRRNFIKNCALSVPFISCMNFKENNKLFFDIGLVFKENQMILDFYNLFGQMISSLSKNRISAGNAYKVFKSLLNKYKGKGNRKERISKKRSINQRKKGMTRKVRKQGMTRGARKKIKTIVKKKTPVRRGNKNRRA